MQTPSSRYSSSLSSEGSCPPVQLRKLQATHEGWLYKQSTSSFMRTWKRRYVVLSDERLYIFKESFDSTSTTSVVALSNFRSVRRVTNTRKTPYGMVLMTHRRSSVFDDPTDEVKENFELELYAESEAQLNNWLEIISKILVNMDMRSFVSPLTSFDALLQRAGNMQNPMSSVRSQIAQNRATLSQSPSTATLVSNGSMDAKAITPPNSASALARLGL
ncbi:hypothetical protein FBU59_000594 [Linderina macrospora]|uniref:Uncharacterized protein n=1 Tax=Linderina macrospora TaxID=4868 RepID=A0ACC1JGC8_9FUNG|nr:hypothetical protein FBU59_000594 [Linderina macrospora]